MYCGSRADWIAQNKHCVRYISYFATNKHHNPNIHKYHIKMIPHKLFTSKQKNIDWIHLKASYF